MARLLLVTRSMALSLRLADAHDVVERTDEDLDTLAPEPETDVVVLDVPDPRTAIETVEGLRNRGVNTPILIVSGYQAEWAGLLELDLPASLVVPLPITRAALLDGIDRLLSPSLGPAAEPETVAVPPVVPPHQHEPDLGAAPPSGPAPLLDLDPPARRFPMRRAAPSAPPTPATHPVPVVTEPQPDLVLGDDYDPFFASAPQTLDDLQPETAVRQADASVVELVRALLERSEELYGVPETAQVLADEIVERADADAAAVLIPDGSIWRVAAGVGLRPLERRLVLESSHWLIAEAALQGRALLIEDTDIVRQKIAGAPLAAWKHLMCLPLIDLRAALVVARGGEAGPFTERDLAAVIDPIREATGLLDRALDVRRLARQLAPLRDLDERRGRG